MKTYNTLQEIFNRPILQDADTSLEDVQEYLAENNTISFDVEDFTFTITKNVCSFSLDIVDNY